MKKKEILKKKPKVLIQAKIDSDLFDKIDKIAKLSDVSLSRVVEVALTKICKDYL